MLNETRRLLNAVNNSTDKWQKNGFQRRTTVTDLHGIESTQSMDNGVPAQFYTSVSYDYDRFIHWWLKIIINPYKIKKRLDDTNTSGSSLSFNGDGTYSGGDITYAGNTLKSSVISKIMEVSKKYGLLPSGLISQLYLESNWGASYEGQTDHNWGGLTGTAQTRPSGVVVTTGNARPANEGGYYMHFASDEDFIQDYAYLLAEEVGGNNQKLYQVSGKTNFDDFTRGLFREGGALYDYAAVGYPAYVSTMNSVKSGVNSSNQNILDVLDNQVLNGKNSTTENKNNTGKANEKAKEKEKDKPKESQKQAPKTASALADIESKIGQTIGSGQCYGLVAYYSKLLDGPGLGGGVTAITDLLGGGINASDIGTDYGWGKHGWAVTVPNATSALKVGAIVNIKPFQGAPLYTGEYGHTAVIKALDDKTITVLEQNVGGKQVVQENTYDINAYLSCVSTLCLPPEIADGASLGGQAGGGSQVTTIKFPEDITVSIDGIDFTPMFKAQYGGNWINKYAIYPSERPNEGYDVMLAAHGLTEEERKRIYTSGEHIVEVNGSIQADVTMRVYLKYNHLN